MSARYRSIARAAAAVAAPIAAFLVRVWILRSIGGELPHYLTFYPAVMLVALWAGLGPGLVATAIAALIADFWILPPRGWGISNLNDAIGLTLFTGMGVFMSVVAGLYRRTSRHMEALVAQRTAELAQVNERLLGEVEGRKLAQEGLSRLNTELEQRVQERTTELRLANAYNRSLLEASLDPMVTINADGKITDANDATEKATGRSRRELVGTDFSDYFTEPEDARTVYQQVFREGWVQDYALEIRHRDGHLIPVLYNASVYRDAQGEVLGVFAAARDVTERKRAEEAVKQERQRLHELFERLPVYVALLTPDYHIPYANRTFRERFGESNGKCCYEALFGRIEPCDICETFKVLETHEPHMWEWIGPDSRDYDVFDFPFTDSDGSPMIMEMGIDVTDQKRLQQELRQANEELEQRVAARTSELQSSNKELETFAYSVSHDLRAPLRAMDGFSQALLEDYAGVLDQEGRGHLNRIRAASQRMGELIDGILGLSRTTRSEMRRTTVDMSDMVQLVVGGLRKTEPQREVELVIEPGLIVNADANLLRIMLQNLMGNAWKFTGKHPRARIEVGAKEQEGERVYFVRDDGAGFDMKYADSLFGAFRRLHSTAEFEGTGVGLATVQRVVLRHGGRVWAEGQVEQGATFFFTLPSEARP